MQTLVNVKPLNRWDYTSIRPGPVGSVGDVNIQTRLKQSNPDMATRWANILSHEREPRGGSNVSDGQWTSYDSGGGPAYTKSNHWGMNRSFKTENGWVYQDLRARDKLHEPTVGATPQYSWNNKVATLYEAKRTGNMFLPKMDKIGLPRGGQTMRVTDEVGGEEMFNNVGTHQDSNGLRIPISQHQRQMEKSRMRMK